MLNAENLLLFKQHLYIQGLKDLSKASSSI